MKPATEMTYAQWLFYGVAAIHVWIGVAVLKAGHKLATTALGSSALATSRRSPFVVEGDEYDAVYWNKKPKFFDYVGVGRDDVAMITSIELDHIDIYASEAVYEAQ